MNVLFSLDNYDHGTGGAEMCAQGLARHLAAHGHQVHVLQVGPDVASYELDGVQVHTHPLPSPRLVRDRDYDTLRWNRAWPPVLERFLSEHPTDLIVTQNRLLISSVAVARERGIPSVIYVLAYGMFCPRQFRDRDALTECDRECTRCLPWSARLKLGATRRTLEAYEQGMRRASLVVACSGYVRDVVRHFYDIDAEVVYPAVDPEHYASEGDPQERECILFIKPQYVKGFPIFVEVAKRLPDRRFLVAGKPSRHARLRLTALPNAECTGWVTDMCPVYARSRLLLGPSIWPEPFGRVFVEAGANGIPSLASARGGIPEAVGDPDGLIDDIFDIDRWVEAIRQLDDPGVYAARSAQARAHAQRFAGEAVYQQFATAVSKALGMRL